MDRRGLAVLGWIDQNKVFMMSTHPARRPDPHKITHVYLRGSHAGVKESRRVSIGVWLRIQNHLRVPKDVDQEGMYQLTQSGKDLLEEAEEITAS